MQTLKFRRTISDPVHGNIGITEVEDRIVNTDIFQRLRFVGQLGLVKLTFPSADYSRFAHSLGVCHLTGNIVNSIMENSGEEVDLKQLQLYRLAGLLHDIGHLPFSHATEDASKKFYEREARLESTDISASKIDISASNKGDESVSHEKLGGLIVRSNEEINEILRDFDYDPEHITDIFNMLNPSKFPYSAVVASDLDADRIDYLQRTSMAAGLPYGKIDAEYLIRNLTFSKSQVVLKEKALRSAEHFLISRLYEYYQIIYNKTVVAFEEVLIKLLIRYQLNDKLNLSKRKLEEYVKQSCSDWCAFDDVFGWNLFRESLNSDDKLESDLAKCLCYRKVPKLLYEKEVVADNTNGPAEKANNSALKTHNLVEVCEKFAREKGLDPECIFSWKKQKSLCQINQNDDGVKSISILLRNKNECKPIYELPNSFIGHYMSKALSVERIYLIDPEGKFSASYSEFEEELNVQLQDNC